MAIINGTNGSNELNGTGGNDTINGFAGDDFIFGEYGRDILNGGNGNDQFEITAQGQIVAGETYNGGIGTDTLYLPTADPINLSAATIGVDVRRLRAFGSIFLKAEQLRNFDYISTKDIRLNERRRGRSRRCGSLYSHVSLNNAGNTSV